MEKSVAGQGISTETAGFMEKLEFVAGFSTKMQVFMEMSMVGQRISTERDGFMEKCRKLQGLSTKTGVLVETVNFGGSS